MKDILYAGAACSGFWRGSTYFVRVVYFNTPYSDTVSFSFGENGLKMQYEGYPNFLYRKSDISILFQRTDSL